MNFKSIAKKHWPLLGFILFYLAISLLTYKDFGATGDEWTESRAAESLIRYMKRPMSYETIIDPKYNDKVDFEIGHHPLTTKYQRSYQVFQTLLNKKGYYEWDHLINLVFGSLIFIIAYAAFYTQYKSVWKSMIPVAFMALTPRLVGHIPSNNKDFPFAVMYLAALAAIYFLHKKSTNLYVRILVLGIIFGLMQTFRTVGFSVYFVYLGYIIYSKWLDREGWNLKSIVNQSLELILIAGFSFFISMSVFPWLGSNFFANMYQLLLNAKSFAYWDDTVFFNGEYLTKDQRPWHYLFTWILITTPVFILVFASDALILVKRYFKNRLYVLLLFALVVNFALYLILQPTIYNGLRHFLFLLPIIAMLAAISFVYWIEKLKGNQRLALGGIVILNSILVGYNLFTLHPYQYLYFNEFVGGLPGADGRFEMDYWGASYKEATEWLVDNLDLTHDDIIFACNVDYAVDYYSQKEFFMSFGNPKVANYTICDSEIERFQGTYKGEILYEVKRQGVVLNRVRKQVPQLDL